MYTRKGQAVRFCRLPPVLETVRLVEGHDSRSCKAERLQRFDSSCLRHSNKGVLFDIIYNTALRNIEKSIKVIDRITGGTCKNFGSQCSCDSIHGGACKDSQKAFREARKLVEEKGKRWNEWHKDK